MHAHHLHAAHILAVDDEPANLLLLSQLLAGEGYRQVTLLNDPRQVLDAYRQHRPDLILLDLNMPELDGFEVLAQIQALQDPLQPPVIVITAQMQRDFMLRALAAGARDFVTKPYDLGELLLRVRNALEGQLNHAALHGMQARLAELVATRTEAMERAERATRSKSAFLSSMSHELRTPMNAVLGMLQLLETTPLSPKQADYVGKTRQSAHALLAILNDILDFSKVEAGKMELDPTPFQFEPWLQELGFLLFSHVKPGPVALLFDIDPQLPEVLVADALRLRQVLINLMGNAIKFTAQGEVRLAVQLLHQADGQARLRFEVRDTGIGMTPQQAAHVFDGFSQADASTSRRYGGTGLGLAISQRLVRLMGGELAVHSTLGQGSVFFFELTLGAAPTADEPTARPDPWQVLVVAPHPGAREVLQRTCAHLGHQATVCETPEQALRQLSAARGTGAACEAVWLDADALGDDPAHWVAEFRAKAGEPPPALFLLARPGRELGWPTGPDAAVDGWLFQPWTPRSLASGLRHWALHGQAGAAMSPATPPAPGNHIPGLPGVRILLVEDNPINQEVAIELLAHEGATTALAENGVQALELLAQGGDAQFDVVLMDMQMDQMDGLDATRLIRQQLGLGALPIVAMTANAMASDRQACLEAGMNDHIGKPFDAQALVAVVRRVLGQVPAEQPPSGQAPCHIPPASNGADRPVLDPAGALARLRGDAAFYRKLLQRFVETSPAQLQQALHALAAGQQKVAGRALHTLKGSASVVGALALQDQLAAAEHALDQPAPLDAAGLHAQLQQALAAAQGVLGPSPPPAPPHTSPPTPELTDSTRAELQQLLPLLVNCEFEALDRLEDLLTHQRLTDPTLVATLRAAADAIDFEAAHHCLSLWLADGTLSPQ